MDDYTIRRIEECLAHPAFHRAATVQEHSDACAILAGACNPVAIRALLDRLKAAEAEVERLREALRTAHEVWEREAQQYRDDDERLRKALTDVIADLEHEGGDGWMTGQVHADEYKAARAALENTDEG